MSEKRHRGAPEPTCGTLLVTSDNSPTFDGTGPQNGPEGTRVANEWVVDLYAEHSGVRCERIVRCRNCRALDLTDVDWRDWCFCRNFREYVQPSGFCAWGKLKED